MSTPKRESTLRRVREAVSETGRRVENGESRDDAVTAVMPTLLTPETEEDVEETEEAEGEVGEDEADEASAAAVAAWKKNPGKGFAARQKAAKKALPGQLVAIHKRMTKQK